MPNSYVPNSFLYAMYASPNFFLMYCRPIQNVNVPNQVLNFLVQRWRCARAGLSHQTLTQPTRSRDEDFY